MDERHPEHKPGAVSDLYATVYFTVWHYGIRSLNAGDEVRFGVVVSSYNNYGLYGQQPIDGISTQAMTTHVSGGLVG